MLQTVYDVERFSSINSLECDWETENSNDQDNEEWNHVIDYFNNQSDKNSCLLEKSEVRENSEPGKQIYNREEVNCNPMFKEWAISKKVNQENW